MATLPLLLSFAEELDNLTTPSFFDDFGVIYPNHLTGVCPSPVAGRLIPTRRLFGNNHHKLSQRSQGNPAVGKDGFQVSMDVQQFKPNELTVKTVDNCVVVEGKHEEREDDHGHISRHFVRKYTLPKDYDPKDVVSALSSDGVLTIKVPHPNKSINGNERIVQIQHTGPAHLSVKGNPPDDKKKDDGAAADEKKD